MADKRKKRSTKRKCSNTRSTIPSAPRKGAKLPTLSRRAVQAYLTKIDLELAGTPCTAETLACMYGVAVSTMRKDLTAVHKAYKETPSTEMAKSGIKSMIPDALRVLSSCADEKGLTMLASPNVALNAAMSILKSEGILKEAKKEVDLGLGAMSDEDLAKAIRETLADLKPSGG